MRRDAFCFVFFQLFFKTVPPKCLSVDINSLLLIYVAYVINIPLTKVVFSGATIQVYLGQDGQVEVYANMTIQPNSPINRNLLLDQNGAHVYIMTKTTVSIKMLLLLWTV